MADTIMKEEITLPIYIVDAFTSKPFSGNQAAICLDSTTEGLSESLMQSIAAEMNLSETAFVRNVTASDSFESSERFSLRWFTPTVEVPLCGHATLASSAALFFGIGNTCGKLVFSTLSGDLFASRSDNIINLDLPLNTPCKYEDIACLKPLLKAVVGDMQVKDVYYSQETKKLLVRLDDSYSRSDLEELKVDQDALFYSRPDDQIKGVIVTMKYTPTDFDDSEIKYDFLSRYFAPWVGIPEDPVTGSAHTVLAGYWSKQLDKKSLNARQCSRRGGDLQLSIMGQGRVGVAGPATIVVKGTISI